jgi:hypothetical protein
MSFLLLFNAVQAMALTEQDLHSAAVKSQYELFGQQGLLAYT